MQTSGATGYQLNTTSTGYRLSVSNPWQGGGKKTFDYILEHKSKESLPSWQTGDPITIPVHRVICTSTTHIAFLHALKKSDCIVGISGKGLVTDTLIRRKLDEGAVADIGYDAQLNVEKILELHPDVVFMYGINKQFSQTVTRLERLGIPVIIIGDYLEPTLLSRLDWIRFFGAFFNSLAPATQYYDSVSRRYHEIMNRGNDEHPTVLTGLPWNEVWYVSGNGSLIANTIADAGGDYLFSNLDNPEAVPKDIEQVFRMAGKAEIWINAGTAQTLTDIKNLDPRLGMFLPVTHAHVYNNNKRLTPAGGNDYWESGVIHPDWILEDLISIFHPSTAKEHTLYYYKKLAE